MQGDKSGSSEFSVANQQDPMFEIDVSTHQSGGFRDPKSRSRNQTEQRGATGRPQPTSRGQVGRGIEQCTDLSVGIDVRGQPTMCRPEQLPWRDLCGRIELSTVLRKAAQYLDPGVDPVWYTPDS